MLGPLGRLAWYLSLFVLGVQGVGDGHATSPQQQQRVRQVAVIGAGAGGSSAAFHLSRFAVQDGVPVNVTVFERTPRIGGRTLTVDVHGDPANPVELGASIFVEVNSILYDAVKEFGLPLRSFDDTGLMVVWDGDKFAFEQDDSHWRLWNYAKLVLKYGVVAPWRAQSLMKATVASFLELYKAPYFPFRSLTERAFELDLLQAIAVPGDTFLERNKVSKEFARDIIQAGTRVNYASDLSYIHGLETMVSIASDGAMAVNGGNWRIFSTMLERCNATCIVLRDTSVSSISRIEFKAGRTGPGRYAISTSTATAEEDYPVVFDAIVVATPWQFANVTADGGILQQKIDEIPYTELHVTLFTSPLRLSPAYFGLPPDAKPPRTVLTTLAHDDEPKPGPDGVGKPGFYSVSTVGSFVNPRTGRDEFAYKIFSPQAVTSEFLSRLLGVHVPDMFAGGGSNPNDGSENGGDHDEPLPGEPISWYYPHVFHSYPIPYPRISFQEPFLADGLYYTSGIESFISTMETSALMGKNVARLMMDDFLDERRAGDALQGTIRDRKQQQVLAADFGGMPDGMADGGEL